MDDINTQLGILNGGGGAFTWNGQGEDLAGMLGQLATCGLDAGDLAMIQRELQDIINQIKWRHLPFQYIPTGEGSAPTVHFCVPGGSAVHPQRWTLGTNWDREPKAP